jgi:phosphoadenosine phosphosulfate reductase
MTKNILDTDLFGTDKVKNAIDLLKYFEPKDKPYYLAFSGGKDSIVIHELARMSGVKFQAFHQLTTIDPPEVIRFIKSEYPNCLIHRPKESMWDLIIRKGTPPTRMIRYCCAILKEEAYKGEFIILGVRRSESAKRSKREFIEVTRNNKPVEEVMRMNDNTEKRNALESCVKQNKRMINPILDWSDAEVWQFIKANNLKYPILYDEGWARIGCIGCPLSHNAEWELEKYPKYKAQYIRTFEKMLITRKEKGLSTNMKWRTGQEVYDWWIGISGTPNQENEFDF